ncbi:MAG: hypothetical protein Q9184_004780 [Pyrenodesmia sp. 2 TL-2023]
MYLLPISIILSLLNYTVSAYKLGDMKPAYVLAGSGAPGSCNSNQVEELQNSFREAVTATQQAILAIENLKKSAPLFNRDRRRTWKRQAQLLKALFNVDVDKSKGLGSDNQDANVVQAAFQKMINDIDYQRPEVGRRNWVLCGDDWLHWTAPTDIDVLDDEKRPLAVAKPDIQRGAFLGKVITPMARLEKYIVISNASPGPNPMCTRLSVEAGTLDKVRAITFCDRAFGKDSLQKAKGSISTGDALDSKLTMAHLWVHEWGHLVNEYQDEEAVDGSGNLIQAPANGWTRTANLARWDPERAAKAPDNYALFATAVYFDNYGWGSGAAEK